MAKQWFYDKDEHPKDGHSHPHLDNKHHETTTVEDETITHGPRFKTWQIVAISLAVVVIGSMTYLWIQISKGLPTLDQLENPHPEIATRLISADGEPLDQYYIKNRTTIHLKNVPQHLLQALIATEDRDFYSHWGINLWGNIRAAWTDVITMSPRQGASTITQQLARNLYLTQEKSMLRKFREMASAVQIERTHTKSEILEMYLNVAYFGRGAYGIEAASQVYFAKDVNQLTPAESAYLVGILKGPENYDPDDNYDHAVARRNTVIDNMVDAKFISESQAQAVKSQPIRTQQQRGYQGIAPHFVEMIRQDLAKKPELQGYDLYRDGLVVYTTLNATMQRAANKAVLEHVIDYQKNVVDKRWNWAIHKGLLDTLISKGIRGNSEYRIADAAHKPGVEKSLRGNQNFIDSVKTAEIRMQCGFVCLDQQTGQILAMVGSSNFATARYGLNHVTQIVRQPGSSFKPIIYAACFENGSTPESQVSNQPISIPDGDHVWSPGNFEGEAVGGYRTIRTALQFSVNLCAVHAMLELTSIHDVITMAKRLGIRTNIPAYPSIALGTAEVNPLELTSAYSTFANEGVRATPYAIVRVEDRNGKIIYRAKPEFQNVLEPRIAHMMTSALSDVVNSGTAVRIRALGFHYPAAGKTGTTQNYADAWFIGYTPHFTAGVWVGFDDKRVSFTAGADGQGGRAAAPIWGRFMKYTYEALRPQVQYFETSYTNTPGAGQAAVHGDVTDSNLPPIQMTPSINGSTRTPKPVKPTPAQPLPSPNTDGGTSGVTDNSDNGDIPSIGQSQPTPNYKPADNTYGPTLPPSNAKPTQPSHGITVDNAHHGGTTVPPSTDGKPKPSTPPQNSPTPTNQ